MAMPFASLSPAAEHHRRPSPITPFCRPSPFYSSFAEQSPHQQQHQNQHQQQNQQGMRWAAPFTAAQYEELEQQALIYKYLVAGVPVPPDLLLPIRRSRFYHLPALGYGSYFGKKLDPEPGRCRRTDGKKWRCSKEAAHDSKYCERHMHRGRNRSRKPVETQLVASPVPQLQTPAAAFQSHSLYPAIATSGGGCGTPGSFALGSTQTQLHLDNAAPYATVATAANKDFRYSTYGARASVIEEHNQLITAATETTMDNYSWRLMPTQASAFSLSSYPMLGTLGDLDQSVICSLPKAERVPLSFFGSGAFDDDDDSVVKPENQTLWPFFDEWPKARDSWPELRDHDINNNNNINAAFSATKLSISIPISSSDFSTTGSRSPHGIYSR